MNTRNIIKELYEYQVPLYKDLVGTLYPQIVYNDLMNLMDLYVRAGGDINEITYVQSPSKLGYSR
jgi:hypothetical protein